ncbi:Hop1p [Lachancea thermotolerans CBS 6340]|uniref:KLTH0A04972p n=1 Tax=Lachancea thermotolerans (strain ATCC 56472 / CBS 6340 / NRRL Y-8284) TaxID=559295 RepID=C5DBS4_LACTC|nr:KLTH0A04972p [Lachancea thermotolerans CBS 6340]CAR21231.1 KLTH0A04972p [Lachancea thermotolerans CBS 6340]
MSTAQQTKPKTVVSTTTGITCEQSQKLVQTMLTMSFGCLSFLRGLFPDDNFIDQRFVPEKVIKNYNKDRNEAPANSIKIKTLVRGKTPEADLFLDWLEKGVFQSIKVKYLKALSLGVFTHEEAPSDLLENYLFSFSYGDDGQVSMGVNGEEGEVSLLDSRRVVQQLMRRFIIITQSLEPLPEKRFLTMRLLFNENAPPEYQPQYFRDATYDKPSIIKIPKSADLDTYSVGSIDTKFHEVSLKVLSVVESTNDASPVPTRDIDPFSLVEPVDAIEETNLSFSQVAFETPRRPLSQTTKYLKNYLTAPSAEVANTQHLNEHDTYDCQCAIPCPQSTSKSICCTQCKRKVHRICYGNYRRTSINKCISCLMKGKSFNCRTWSFKTFMMLRRIYRFMIKKPDFPSTLSEFYEILAGTDTDPEIKRCINVSISILFYDEVFVLEKERRPQTSSKNQFLKSSNYITIDQSGIVVKNLGELPLNTKPVWSFIFNSAKAQAAYTTALFETPEQVSASLESISAAIKKVEQLSRTHQCTNERAIGSSFDFNSLRIDDDTQDSLGPLKRKHPNLRDFLDNGKNSQLDDTLDMHSYKPQKIRKISASKKTLKSVW